MTKGSAMGETAGERRSEERRDCWLEGVLHLESRSLPCSVKDLGFGGVGFTLNSANRLKVAASIGIETEPFGRVEGVVRWAAHPRYGMEFPLKARVPKAYLDYFETLSPQRMLQERFDFLLIGDRAREDLSRLGESVQRRLPGALDSFYDQVKVTPGLRKLFVDAARMDSARRAQISHWERIVSGNLGPHYFDAARRIGLAHAHAGLDPRWYIAGYAHVLSRLVEDLVRDAWPKSLFSRAGAGAEGFARGLGVLVRAAFLDMDLAISSYLHADEAARAKEEAAPQPAHDAPAPAPAPAIAPGRAIEDMVAAIVEAMTQREQKPAAPAPEPAVDRAPPEQSYAALLAAV